MNSVRLTTTTLLLFYFLSFSNVLLGQICGINSVEIIADQSNFCETPAFANFNAVLNLEDEPEFILSRSSSNEFQAPFTINDFATDNSGCLFALRIQGSYAIWSNPTELVDACYRFGAADNQEIRREDPVGLTITMPLFVQPDGYNELHDYWFFYEGNGQNINIQFTDGGQFDDNSGEMTFEWYSIPCYDTIWTVLGADLPGQTMRTLSFPNPGSFDVGLQIIDRRAGCIESATTTIRISEPIATMVDVTNSCPDGAAGTAAATVTGGSAPFQYIWDGGGPDNPFFDNLTNGMHQLVVVDALGCSDTTDFEIFENTRPVIELATNDPSCSGLANGNIEIINPEATWLYSLDNLNFQSTPLFQNLTEGGYRIFIQDIDGCVFSDSTDLFAVSSFEVEIPTTISIARGDSETISANVTGGTPTFIYEWSPATGLSCSDCANPTVSPQSTTTYTVMVTDIMGCMATASILVNIPEPDPNEKQVFIPTAFSPNNDGINDFFNIFPQSGVENITQFAVFDRWGGLVYKNENFLPNLENQGWDGMWKGKFLDTGVYTWFAEIDWEDGVQTMHEGEVSLFRVQ